jgi:trans-aconitate 2-methyltransferase
VAHEHAGHVRARLQRDSELGPSALSWSPQQYERFKAERQQPFYDLLALVQPIPQMRIADLGCGTGELTRVLHERLEAAETVGIDNSEEMLKKAPAVPRFQVGDIATFNDRPFDLIFSNAALHWVPDHEQLIRRLAGLLSERGQIAIQMPANDGHLSHTTAAEVAAKFGAHPREDYLLPLERYAALLHDLGFKQQQVRMQIYGHELSSSRDVVEWVRGALLTDYERQLGANFPAFLADYTREFIARAPTHTPYFYTYNRILLWGQV